MSLWILCSPWIWKLLGNRPGTLCKMVFVDTTNASLLHGASFSILYVQSSLKLNSFEKSFFSCSSSSHSLISSSHSNETVSWFYTWYFSKCFSILWLCKADFIMEFIRSATNLWQEWKEKGRLHSPLNQADRWFVMGSFYYI